MRSLILDTETNGIGSFRPARQRIVQWSWITPDNVERNYFIKGATEISPHVPHDITVDFLNAKGTEFDTVFKQFMDDLSTTDKIVAHNVKFDVGCIRNELKLRGYPEVIRDKLFHFPLYCTMQHSTKYCNIRLYNKDGTVSKTYKWPKLEELHLKLFQTEPTGVLHDSLWDCRILQKCFQKGIEEKVFC